MADSYSVSLSPAQSFHSTLWIQLPGSVYSNRSSACSLEVFLHLPPHIIVDPYLLPQAPAYEFFGDTELELPLDRLLPRGLQGSGLRVRFDGDLEWSVHLDGRYLPPTKLGLAEVLINHPWVGWVCQDPKPSEGTLHLPLPFPPSLLDNLSFHPLQAQNTSPLILTLPVGHPSHLPSVEQGTVLAVWACAGWVAWKAWRALRRSRTEKVAKKDT